MGKVTQKKNQEGNRPPDSKYNDISASTLKLIRDIQRGYTLEGGKLRFRSK